MAKKAPRIVALTNIMGRGDVVILRGEEIPADQVDDLAGLIGPEARPAGPDLADPPTEVPAEPEAKKKA